MIYLASYRGRGHGVSRMVGALIRWVTRSKWSHCEIALGDAFSGPVLCISASGMDGGVRGKVMQLDPDRWELTPLPGIYMETAQGAFRSAEGAGYDWAGVLRFALPPIIRGDHPRRWFCSEFCAAVMGLHEPWRFSPADLRIIASRFA